MSQLSEWTPDIPIKPWPLSENCESEFISYDLVLADDSSILGKHFQNEKGLFEISKKICVYRNRKAGAKAP